MVVTKRVDERHIDHVPKQAHVATAATSPERWTVMNRVMNNETEANHQKKKH
jgi:hypothetical protein